MFDRSKPKIGCSSSISKRRTHLSSFIVQKSDVRFYLMDNLVKAFWVRCSMSAHSKPNFRHLSSIINRWTCSSSFDVRKNGVRPISMNSSEAKYDIVYLMFSKCNTKTLHFQPQIIHSANIDRQRFLLSFSKSSSKKSLESLNGKLNFASQRNACYFPIVNKFCFSLRIARFALMICFVSHQGVDCECPLVVYLFYSYPFWFNVAPYSLHLLDRFRTFDLLFVFNFNFSPFSFIFHSILEFVWLKDM